MDEQPLLYAFLETFAVVQKDIAKQLSVSETVLSNWKRRKESIPTDANISTFILDYLEHHNESIKLKSRNAIAMAAQEMAKDAKLYTWQLFAQKINSRDGDFFARLSAGNNRRQSRPVIGSLAHTGDEASTDQLFEEITNGRKPLTNLEGKYLMFRLGMVYKGRGLSKREKPHHYCLRVIPGKIWCASGETYYKDDYRRPSAENVSSSGIVRASGDKTYWIFGTDRVPARRGIAAVNKATIGFLAILFTDWARALSGTIAMQHEGTESPGAFNIVCLNLPELNPHDRWEEFCNLFSLEIAVRWTGDNWAPNACEDLDRLVELLGSSKVSSLLKVLAVRPSSAHAADGLLEAVYSDMELDSDLFANGPEGMSSLKRLLNVTTATSEPQAADPA